MWPLRWLLALLLVRAGAASAQDFANSYAIVVGVDDYSSLGMKHLNNAEADASAVARYFSTQGYQVTPLITAQSASKRAIDAAVNAIAARITDSDRFVFFFAGHGKAQRTEDVDVAYLVVPGGRDKNDPASLVSTGDIVDYSRRLDKARHQLFIFDSCYAGLMGQFQKTRADDMAPVRYDSEVFLQRDLGTRRVRQYLSAGGEDQEVLDDGPAKLSWFTYFLLKGLEPGVVSKRASGLITFSELASYVQAYCANPKHTPAFGSLAGDRGGQYLLLSSAKGNPPLPVLPDISVQTLRDMGFLTRSDAPSQVGAEMDRMRQPIDLLYQAWLQKDLALYLRQLDREVVQTGRLKNGSSYSRGYDEIAAKRRKDFARLEHVDVLKYELMYQGSEGDRTTFGVRYSMDFHWRDGSITRERNLKECYCVRKPTAEDRWVIARNDDYQQRICYR